MSELYERLIALEQRMCALERMCKTATGFDAHLQEDTEMLRGLIAETPGMSQSGVARAARRRCDLPKARVVEVLRSGIGKQWRVEAGMYNSLLYFPVADRMHPEVEQIRANDAQVEMNCADVSR